MKILAVEHVLPGRRVTNDDVLRLVGEHNRDHLPRAELAALTEDVERLLDSAGTRERYALAEGEKAVSLVVEAGKRALREADIAPDAVEFMIYVGVGRAFLEPATANVIQAELGLVNATCFDVLDGCASWLRALQVAQLYLATGTYRCGLIVNGECGFTGYMTWRMARRQDLAFHFATFTIGEAATATLVGADEANDLVYFKFRNFGDHYELCMIPFEDAPAFLRRVPQWYGAMKLYSRSRELLGIAADKIVETFTADPVLSGGRYDIVFGHAASKKAEEGVLQRLGIPVERYFGTHATHGNTVSASVPLAMSLSRKQHRLRRGDRVLVIMAAGGIAIGFGAFTF
jgi:3-oxoacyl-[acyl-carrier-protein] synthase III